MLWWLPGAGRSSRRTFAFNARIEAAWHAVAFVFVPHALKKLPQGTHDDPSAKDPLHPPLFVPSFA